MTLHQLEQNEIHVWCASMHMDARREQALCALLSGDELEKLARRRNARACRQLIASRGMLRERLAAVLQCSPTSLTFGYGEHEKPYLVGPRAPSFNVSHSGDVLHIAIARDGELGIDVERIRSLSDLDAVARRFFSESEQHAIVSLPPSARTLAFYRCWTRKEAFIKARGLGLSLPLDQFDVAIDADAALIATRPDAKEAERFHLHNLSAPEGYVAALACTHRAPTIREHSLTA